MVWLGWYRSNTFCRDSGAERSLMGLTRAAMRRWPHDRTSMSCRSASGARVLYVLPSATQRRGIHFMVSTGPIDSPVATPQNATTDLRSALDQWCAEMPR
jgi:hypothetical protein